MFIRIFSTTYYLPLHHRNWFSPIFFSWTRLPEAASYVGFTAGGFHACDKLFWSCPQLFSHGVTCIHPSTCDSHFALEAKTERVTRDVLHWIHWRLTSWPWVSFKDFLSSMRKGMIRTNTASECWELCHVACPEGTQHSTTSGSSFYNVSNQNVLPISCVHYQNHLLLWGRRGLLFSVIDQPVSMSWLSALVLVGCQQVVLGRNLSKACWFMAFIHLVTS